MKATIHELINEIDYFYESVPLIDGVTFKVVSYRNGLWEIDTEDGCVVVDNSEDALQAMEDHDFDFSTLILHFEAKIGLQIYHNKMMNEKLVALIGQDRADFHEQGWKSMFGQLESMISSICKKDQKKKMSVIQGEGK